ncbi:hypothetical protein MBANPS3_004424 [Mucor bainieri]
MATDREIHAQLRRTNAERQLLELQIEGQRYKRLRTTSARRVQHKRNPKISSPDQIVFTGLKETLGGRALSVGNNMELNGWKSKCVAYLCRNVIIDFTNKDQLKCIGVTLEKLNSRYQLLVQGAERDLPPLYTTANKIGNHTSIKSCSVEVEAFQYSKHQRQSN